MTRRKQSGSHTEVCVLRLGTCVLRLRSLRPAIGRFQPLLKYLFHFKNSFHTIPGAWRGEMGVSGAFPKFCSLIHNFTLMVLLKKGNKFQEMLLKRPI